MAEKKIFTIENRPKNIEGEFVIPEGFTAIGIGAFEFCTSLTSIVIPDSVIAIGDGAFKGCTNLTSVVIPNSVGIIGASAFKDCTNLTSVVIPNSVTKIGNNAFYNCRNLASVEIPNSVTEIGYNAFYACGITSIVIPESLTKIAQSTFEWCDKLTSVVILNSVAKIGDRVFLNCKKLASIVLPESVTEIGSNAFCGCGSLTYFEYPSTLKINKKKVFGDIDTKKIKFESKKSPSVVELNSVADLKDQVICVSGKFKDHSQEEMEALVTSNGATVSSSVTKKTTVLVTGDKVGATKLTKAQELGIKILSQEEFFNILNGGTNGPSAVKGMRKVHIMFEVTDYSRWDAEVWSRKEVMDFISENSDEEIDLDDEEGLERACEIIDENLDDDFYPRNINFWNPKRMTLTVEDEDDTLKFGADELGSVPVKEVNQDSKSQGEFVLITELLAKYPSFEADIEIEGDFDVSKLSVVSETESFGDDTYSRQTVLYDGENLDLELTYDRGVGQSVYLKKM